MIKYTLLMQIESMENMLTSKFRYSMDASAIAETERDVADLKKLCELVSK